MKTIYAILSVTNIVIWTLVSLVIIGSAYYEIRHLILNGAIGLMILIVPVFSYQRRRNTLKIWRLLSRSEDTSVRTFVILTILQCLFGLTVGVVGLSAVISRTLGEGYPVFG